MSQEISSVCQHCAAEKAQREEVSFTIKYVLAIVSASMLGLGLILEYMSFDPIIFYIPFIVALLASGRWVIPNGLRSMIKAHLGISFLMTVASIGAMFIGVPAEGASVMILFYLAELLEEKSGDRARREIESLVKLEPPTVTAIVGDIEECISPDHVAVGQTIIVRPGERIGLDGDITKGQSRVNQAPITGESLPVEKSKGDQVFAGSINLDGYLEIKVTKESKDSVLSRIIHLVQEARKDKSPTERYISKIAHIYTPIVVVGAFLLALTFLLLGAPLIDAVYRGLTLLVISCPCAFALSIPITMVSTLAGSAREGVLVKGASHIEELSKVTIVAFDKTGTLTKGDLAIDEICIHSDTTEEQILRVAYALEHMSEHPIAEALVEAATSVGIENVQADEFYAIPGRGVKGSVRGEEYLVGSRTFLDDEKISLEEQDGHSCGSGTLVYVVRNSQHMGTIALVDTARENARNVIKSLHKKGIKTLMLTGDNRSAAHAIAGIIGIDEIHSNLLPHEKLQIVKKLSESETVLFVGDGINDAPALAASDIGMAMGVMGSDAAIETADIALMDEDLSKIPRLIDRSKKTMSVIRQNVFLSISIKLIIGILAIFGLVSLWLAVALGDMGLTLLVIANALRLVRMQSESPVFTNDTS
ncbi:MAG: heavy metal translocating P-type ATPase [Candidatus Thorarchaeota archaeon]